MSVGRSIGGGVLGFLAGSVTVYVVEVVGHRLWPLPSGVDFQDAEAAAAALAGMPVAALAWVVLGWVLGAFAGGLVATLVSRSVRPALVVGALLLVATVLTFFMFPHPPLMMAAGILLPLPAAWLGARAALAIRRPQPSGS